MVDVTERADWTLLLPLVDRPPRDAIVTDPADRAVLQATLDLSDVRCWALPANEPASLVVVRGTARTASGAAGRTQPLVDVARLVAPGGVLYAEVSRGRLRATVRDLERLGLSVVASYGIAPDAVAARRYVPLDSVDALSWYVSDLVAAPTPLLRFGQIATVAGLRAAGRSTATLLRGRFTDVAIVAARDDTARTRTRYAVLTSGQDVGSRSVVVAFDREGDGPTSVTKVALRPEAFESTRREAARTASLRRTLPFSIASALPRPAVPHGVAIGHAVGETSVRGPSLQVLASRWGRPLAAKAADLRAAIDWFVSFGNTTAVVGGIERPRWVDVFDEAGNLPHLPTDVREMLCAAAVHIDTSPTCHRSVHIHGDAGPWNVYTGMSGRRRIGVIDWEHDGTRPVLGPPLADVIYLVTYWLFAVLQAESEVDQHRALRDLFGADDSVPREVRLARRAIRRAAWGSGLAAADVLPLAVALWATQCVDVRERRHRLGVDEAHEPPRADGYLIALTTAWAGRTA